MLSSVQFLRFVAALLVVLYHASTHLRLTGHEFGALFGFAHAAGFAGVDIFFVISGFIMVWTTQGETGQGETGQGNPRPVASGVSDAWQFARRRVARIYSGYWPFFLLAVVLFSWLGPPYLDDVAWIRSLILWPTEFTSLLIPVSWTLVFEMGFYALFTLLIALNPRFPLTASLWVISAAVLAWVVYSVLVRQAYDPGRLDQMSVYEQYWLFPYLLEFLAGALLAIRLRNKPRGPAWTWLMLGLFLFLFAANVNEAVFDHRMLQGYFVVWRVALFGTASLLLLAGVVRLEQGGMGFMPRFSLLVGGASYALYLSHTLILVGARRLGFDAAMAGQPGWLAELAFLVLSVLIVLYSLAHYRWIERPLHRCFRRWLRS